MIALFIKVQATQQLVLFDRATEMAAFVGKHKLHPWEYTRLDAAKPLPTWHRINPEMKHD